MPANIMTWMLIAEGLLIVGLSIYGWRYNRRFPYWLYLIAGALWVGLYIFVLVADPANYNSVQFARTWIRPLNVFTLGLLAAILLYVVKYGRR